VQPRGPVSLSRRRSPSDRAPLPDDPKLQALITLTRQIADNRGYVDESVWSDALEAGWSEEEILDAYTDVVRTILTNYFNHLVGTELDLPPAP
jgi:alkylhydroperoxidase family enzyme